MLPAADAAISPFDHGLLVGDGVFETMIVRQGRPFAMRRHLDRLSRSARPLELAVPDHDELRAQVDQVLTANQVQLGRLRITITGGSGPLGSERGTDGPTVLIATAETRAWAPTADVVTVPWTRNERSALVGLKTTSYAENVLALSRAKAAGASEAIFANTRDHLCEGTGTNVFIASEGRLLTPPLSSGCLPGVTRELVCELVEVAEEDLPIGALALADEAFLTSSTRDVQPIARVDGQSLASAPGPLTTAAAEAFAALLERTDDP